mmetsp:Transcript_74125/g.141083  ORF Transcript_74125/g.141083 Transcript_74125/m.141083 type:complete len:605 (-) Transcript_74125:170-1984(-)
MGCAAMRAPLFWLPLLSAGAWHADADVCRDEASCQVHVKSLVERLTNVSEKMQGKRRSIQHLDRLRSSIASGGRIELPPVQRQHLARSTPLANTVTYDVKHRPVSTNRTRHLKLLRTLAAGRKAQQFAFMPLKSRSSKAGPTVLLISVDDEAKLSIHTLDGEPLIDAYELGHAAGAGVTHLSLSPNQETHMVVTGDDRGEVRVHGLKVVAKKREAAPKKNATSENETVAGERQPKAREGGKQLSVTVTFTCSLEVPGSEGDEEIPKLSALMVADRGSPKMTLITGDSLGRLAIFNHNGTLKGRAKVTEDPGGVRGLVHAAGQLIIFFSSHTFGYFSLALNDVAYPPCTGWSAPLFDFVWDPTSGHTRAILALEDGDVLAYQVVREKLKVCDLALKFPHVSALPFSLQPWKGLVAGLPTLLESTARRAEHMRELYFFSIPFMEAGYGTYPSRAIALQVDVKPKEIEQFKLYSLPKSGSTGTAGDRDRAKALVAMTIAGERGVELYELVLKQPPPSKKAVSDAGLESSSWLVRYWKLEVLIAILVGVVVWFLRKNRKKSDKKAEEEPQDEGGDGDRGDDDDDDDVDGEKEGGARIEEVEDDDDDDE